jgi:thioredoxin 1
MKIFKVFLAAILAILTLSNSCSQENLQDHSEPASLLVEAAIQNANQENTLVLLYFGAEGCIYCEQLDRVLNLEDIHSILVEHYVPVRIDVGDFDKNLDLFNRYMGKKATGIPALAVLGEGGSALGTITGEEWGESDQEVYDSVILFLLQMTEN